jgi:hypothetical protein
MKFILRFALLCFVTWHGQFFLAFPFRLVLGLEIMRRCRAGGRFSLSTPLHLLVDFSRLHFRNAFPYLSSNRLSAAHLSNLRYYISGGYSLFNMQADSLRLFLKLLLRLKPRGTARYTRLQ